MRSFLSQSGAFKALAGLALRYRIVVAGAVLVLGAAITGAFALKLFEPLPLDRAAHMSQLVLDRHGRILRAFTAADKQWRLPVQRESVSQNYIALLLAFEDRRFWSHPGVDPLAIVRAIVQSARAGRLVSGGSTLTMQVARLLRGSPTGSMAAKAQQVVDALRLEAALSKAEILNLYLELAPYGGNIEGVRAASLAYFGKEPSRLTTAEAALLVAIPQSPEMRRPDRDRKTLVEARDRVIRRGLIAGAVAHADAAYAMLQDAPKARSEFPILAAHLADRLRTTEATGDIKTTLDRDTQTAAEAIVRRHALTLGDKISVAAMIVNHKTGDVIAHVGSAGYFDDSRAGAIDMTAAIRSPGSALKPFIYGLGFEDGLIHPETLIEDRPVRFDHYAPGNFDNMFHGTVSIRQALQLSLNIPAVKILYQVGPAKLSARFREAGLQINVPRNLTVALGGVGLTLEQLTALYVGLARGGAVIPLRYEESKIFADPKTSQCNPNFNELYLPQQADVAIEPCDKSVSPTEHREYPEAPRAENRAAEAPRLLTHTAAWYVADILRGVAPPDGSAPGSIAFKTGTSYGYRDAWSAGFDGEHTITVWVGRPDGSPVPGLMGVKSAAPILFDLFQAIGSKRAPFAGAPANVIAARQSADLPPPLRAFHEPLSEAAANTAPANPLRIAYPPENAEIEIGADDGTALSLKAEGGTLPLTWLVDGKPIPSVSYRRDAILEKPGVGFIQVTVVDAQGRSDRTQVRLRNP